ncbi:predicted protein, partial [Nematostella vectensis]
CASGMFQCHNQRCIQSSWRCDDRDDCGDNSDEKNCTRMTCDPSQHTCNNGQCIKASWLCDGASDCQDNSDEMNCRK